MITKRHFRSPGPRTIYFKGFFVEIFKYFIVVELNLLSIVIYIHIFILEVEIFVHFLIKRWKLATTFIDLYLTR